MKNILTAFLIVAMGTAPAQQSLTLAECYALAEQNYPLIKQRQLITSTREYSVENLSKGYLPQLSIYGQATYQSAVTQIPIQVPGIEIETLSKNQYKIYGEISQTIFDGGAIRDQKESQEINAMVEEHKLQAELYKLKERINQLFFGVLLVDEQIRQSKLLINDIQLGLRKTEGALANGTAFKSSLDALKAELLKANQRTVELHALRQAYTEVLGTFINRPVDEHTLLVKPVPPMDVAEINRPEILVYDYQIRMLDTQDKLLSARNLPRLNLFVQGGYGRPALNMLSNDFETYYIGGLRLNWSLSGLYTTRGERALIDNSRTNIALQKETFLFNTNLTLRQQRAEAGKYRELLAADDEIISLRTSVKNTAAVQLENGVINTNDYLREVNAEDQARLNKIIHDIQFLMAQYAQLTTSGNAH